MLAQARPGGGEHESPEPLPRNQYFRSTRSSTLSQNTTKAVTANAVVGRLYLSQHISSELSYSDMNPSTVLGLFCLAFVCPACDRMAETANARLMELSRLELRRRLMPTATTFIFVEVSFAFALTDPLLVGYFPLWVGLCLRVRICVCMRVDISSFSQSCVA
jgi:hypothetical protein